MADIQFEGDDMVFKANFDFNRLERGVNTDDWPRRYFKRFCNWYVRRNNIELEDLAQYVARHREDYEKHLANWDSGLRKALLKDKMLNKVRSRVKNDKRAEKTGLAQNSKFVYVEPSSLDLYVDMEEHDEK